MQISTSKQIITRFDNGVQTGKTFHAEIRGALMAAVVLAHVHGDIRPIKHMLDSKFAKETYPQATRWLKKHAPIKVKKDGKVEIRKEDRLMDFNTDARKDEFAVVAGSDWYTYGKKSATPAEEKEADLMDGQKVATGTFKNLNKKIVDGKFKITHEQIAEFKLKAEAELAETIRKMEQAMASLSE